MVIFVRGLVFLLYCITLSPAHSAIADPIDSILPKFESLIQKSLNAKKIPGLAVAIVHKGKIIYIKGFGIRTVGKSEIVDQQTLFQLGSVSKAISSTLIAILAKEQVLNLEHPIDCLPGRTLRHVLSHTTGITSGGFNRLIEQGMSPAQTIEKIKLMNVEDPPGTKFIYHNVVYNLLTNVIEQVVGASFEATLQSKLFHPLNMTRTSSTWEAFIAQENRASPHVFTSLSAKKSKKGKKKEKKILTKSIAQKVPYRKEYTNFPAAGGFSSSIHDMAQFLCAVMGSRPDIISQDDLKDFIQPTIHTPDQWQRSQKHRDRISKTEYGLGWRHLIFADYPLVFHGGWIRGFCSTLAFLPEQQLGIVILQNAESSLAYNLSMQFFDWALGLPQKEWIK
jgi:beta-lactamase class C